MTLPLACSVWLPPLCAVFSVMLLPVELIPSVVPAVSAVQSMSPAARSDAEPVVAASVVPVMVVAAVSEAEPWAETEPTAVTPPVTTVCARTKP